MNKILLLFLIFFSALPTLRSQGFVRQIEGRVYSEDGDVTAVHVSNISMNRGTITDATGYFEIGARFNDTLVFSAVQYTRFELVITLEIFERDMLHIQLQELLRELDEVVVMPYNLTGDLNRDMGHMNVGTVVTTSSLGLPNAHLKPPTQLQRKLYTARTWDLEIGFGFKVKTDPLINYFSGRTRRLKKRIALEERSIWIEEVRRYYPDSVFVKVLKIPKNNIGDFIYSCEKDSLFDVTLERGDRLELWEVLKMRSVKYLRDNEISEN